MTPGIFPFHVRAYECGADGAATLPTICNYLQEAASLDAEARGFSKSNFDAAGGNVSWVLTRMRVKMMRYPRWEEKIEVVTFPRGGRRIVAWRDFELRTKDGEVLGVATTEWMLIDLSTRKVVAIPESVFSCVNPDLPPVLGDAPFTPRLTVPPAPTDAPAPLVFKAQKSHIDLNGHVNNVRYIEWMLEPLPTDHTCGEMEIVFRSETLAGDEVHVTTLTTPDGITYHRVASPTGTDHILARTCE